MRKIENTKIIFGNPKKPQIKKIAGRMPENSRNRFVDRPSKKTIKDTKKIRLFIEG